MLHNWIRVFHSDNNVMIDRSIEAQNNPDTVPLDLVSAQDWIYIGQYFPFNSVYFQMTAMNLAASSMQIQYWEGKEWFPAVDIIDGTRAGGATLGRTGIIQFSPDRDRSWVRIADTTERGSPVPLDTVEIYELFWLRMRPNADTTAGTTAKVISYAFTSDAMLSAIDPEIDEYLVPWGGVSKTNWDEQILLGSNHLVADLRARGLISTPGNVLRFDDVSLACAYRTLAFIYSRLGEAFAARKVDALENYRELLNLKGFTFDSSRDGVVQRQEITGTTAGLIR